MFRFERASLKPLTGSIATLSELVASSLRAISLGAFALGACFAPHAAAQTGPPGVLGKSPQTRSQSHSSPRSALVWQGIGRAATPDELKAWDIDVRPDFKGLPKGAGSVAKGQDVWEAKCASCHGVFGESNEVFTPISTGIIKDDIKNGRASGLTKSGLQRSTLMKVATVSTLWDYINRAMPWNAPKTLTVEEVYAATAYLLHLGDVLPADFTLSDSNMKDVQARMPNRNGMTSQHAMWSVTAKPDVNGSACMSNCAPEIKVASFLPEYAKNAHGNLTDQNRQIGGVRGVNTAYGVAAPSSTPGASVQSTAAVAKAPSEFPGLRDLANKSACLACHGVDRKLVGPGFNEIAVKYQNDAKAVAYLTGKIKQGGQGVWGSVPMPPGTVSESEAQKLAQWILNGSPD